MRKREANFTLLFRHWIKAHADFFSSAAFELKQTTTNSLPFSDVQEHQRDALEAACLSPHGLLYKAPDDSRGIKPFDLFYLRYAEAYVVIKYPDCFVIIDSEEFESEKISSKRKSLTSERAKEIARTIVVV